MSILEQQQTIIQQIEAQIQVDKRMAFRKGVEYALKRVEWDFASHFWLKNILNRLTDDIVDEMLGESSN